MFRKFLTGSCLFLVLTSYGNAGQPYGTLLGSPKGVAVYSNEGQLATGQYQCVELVRRYYSQLYGINLKSMYSGNANTWFTNASQMNLVAYPNQNQSNVRPEIGDILTSNSGQFGHVAIITSVTDSQVCVAQQNFDNDWNDGDGTHCMNMSYNSSTGYNVSGFSSGYPTQGWLRQKHTPMAETLQTRAFGNIEWYPQTAQYCSQGTRWWKDGIETGSSVCNEISTFCSASSPNVPEGNNRWESFWRWAREAFSGFKQVFGTYALACTQTTVLRTISIPSNPVLPNSIVAGNGALPNHASGYGSAALITSTASSGTPDFDAKSVILKDSTGTEPYIFNLGVTITISARFKNEGTGNAPQALEVRYYRSNGKKEDSHSEWVRVATSTIQASNMKAGDSKTETVTFTAPTTPGTYNIVACIDRIQDNNNGNGAVLEKHESNNCSKEAVFSVGYQTPEQAKKFYQTFFQLLLD